LVVPDFDSRSLVGESTSSSAIGTPAVAQMGKKNKDETLKPNNVVNRDILQRLNFLYQASVYLESISRQCGGPTLAGAGASGDNSEPPVDDLSTQPVARSALPAAGSPTTPLPKASGRNRPQEQRKGGVIRAADIGKGYVRAMRLIGQKATVKM
jgi:ribonuclease P protein subunit RPR2